MFGTRRVNLHRTWDGAWCIVRRVKDTVPTVDTDYREESRWAARAQAIRKTPPQTTPYRERRNCTTLNS